MGDHKGQPSAIGLFQLLSLFLIRIERPAKWKEDFGFAAEHYPIVATEIGFGPTESPKDDSNAYGPAITNYLESRGIGWVVWCFDAEWGPAMISSWEPYTLTGEGRFFSDAMHKNPAPLATPVDR